MTQVLQVRVISQPPPGAHGAGFPSLLINGVAIQPADGAILMPADLRASLVAAGCDGDRLARAEAALEAPVQRLLGGR